MDTKEILRQAMLRRAAALPALYKTSASAVMRAALLGSEAYRAARCLFLYVSTENEPETREILRQALEEGKTVLVPRCGKDGRMDAVRIEGTDALRPGALGIPEPPAEAPAAAEAPDLVLVPCVSAGKDGGRLGHGGGYYDRWLQSCPAPRICLCFERLRSEGIPMEARDVRMDFLLTEQGLIPCEGDPRRQ